MGSYTKKQKKNEFYMITDSSFEKQGAYSSYINYYLDYFSVDKECYNIDIDKQIGINKKSFKTNLKRHRFKKMEG